MATTTSNTTIKVQNNKVDYANNTKTEVYCKWSAIDSKYALEHYKYNWHWTMANGTTLKGEGPDYPATTTDTKTPAFSVPYGAVSIYCNVQPISKSKGDKTHKVFTSSAVRTKDFTLSIRDQSSETYTPTISSIEGNTVTATVQISYPQSQYVDKVQFQLINPNKQIAVSPDGGVSDHISITVPSGILHLSADAIIDDQTVNTVNNIATFTSNKLSRNFIYRIRCRVHYSNSADGWQSWDVVPLSEEFSMDSLPDITAPSIENLEETESGLSFTVHGTLPDMYEGLALDIIKNGTTTVLREYQISVPTQTYSYKYTNVEYDSYYQARIKAYRHESVGGLVNTVWSTLSEWSSAIGPMDSKPSVPDVPTCEYKDGVLTMRSGCAGASEANRTAYIIFEIFEDKMYKVWTGKAVLDVKDELYNAITKCDALEPGKKYAVRAIAYNDRTNKTSSPSGWSSDILTIPAKPDGFKSIVADRKSATSYNVSLIWAKINGADNYKIEYAFDPKYFDVAGADVKDLTIDDGSITTALINVTVSANTRDDDNGVFFRLAAGNSSGYSKFSDPEHIEIGIEPLAPTTWQSKSVACIGDIVTLYWTHNTRDGSLLTKSLLWLKSASGERVESLGDVGGTDELDLSTKTQYFDLNSSDSKWGIKDSTDITWKVKTRGALGSGAEDETGFGPYSIERAITFYTKPEIAVSCPETPTQFPIHIGLKTTPVTQTPLAYYVSIEANQSYETLDNTYTEVTVAKGQQLFYKHYAVNSNALDIDLTAGNIRLESKVQYKLLVTVAMNSGLSAEYVGYFTPEFSDSDDVDIDIELTYTEDTYSMAVTPSLSDGYSSNIEFGIYRREYDGTFTEIQTGINANELVSITDPHPAMNVARYRIIATDKVTGHMSYRDADFELNEPGAIIQWNEAWKNFIDPVEGELTDPPWAGSLLRLLYNLDISANHSPDVSNLEYIGRSHPVSYYGTQLGESSTWSVDIPSTDAETLYAIRRLAVYQGDVYVRESSGISYWANVTVSYNKNHGNTTIPVSLSVTRVEGGV